jgi:hypothetical protein
MKMSSKIFRPLTKSRELSHGSNPSRGDYSDVLVVKVAVVLLKDVDLLQERKKPNFNFQSLIIILYL